uniref:BMP family ABC transporter substrate-binding protein n=1 Tax=Oceanispirochaeta sp. TaxID=2035350 RepID=UPI00260D5D2E
MKKLTILFTVLLIMTASLFAGGSKEAPAPAAAEEKKMEAVVEKTSVTMVTDVGGVNDQSFNQSAWEGLQRAGNELNLDVSYKESKQNADYMPNMESALDDGNDLIWGIGFMMADAIMEAAQNNPDQKYAIIDSAFEDSPPNLVGVVFQAAQGSYLVGYIAGRMTETQRVGFIGGIKFFLIEEFEYGFKAGVKQAGADIEVISQYAESFTDAAKGKSIANSMYQQGADIIFHAAGGVGNGLIEAAKEQGKWAIGVDRDQNDLAPDNVLTSAMKRVDNGIFNLSKDLAEGNFPGGTTVAYGLAEGGVGIAPSSSKHVPADILADVEKLEKMIIAGEFVVPNTADSYEAYSVVEIKYSVYNKLIANDPALRQGQFLSGGKSLNNYDFDQIAVDMRGITQKFGSLVANDNIDLKVHKGEVHALLGENGAGKTTLVNSLYGLYHPTAGEIFINGNKVVMDSPNIAIQNGIGMVHQHFMLIKPFSVVENIILGMETHKFGVLDMEKATKDIIALSEKYGLTIDPTASIQDITVGMQQRVEILKTLYRGADILILDEPTAVLTPQEILDLIQIIHNLTDQGKTVIIITHKLKEIKDVADFCTIIRRGKKIDTVKVEDVSESDLASMMVGREVSFKVDKIEASPAEIVIEVRNLHVLDNRKIPAVRGLNLTVRRGEILGIAGVDGNGQNELVEALTGLRKAESGEILVNGINIMGLSPRGILDHKVSTIPQDRHKRGLILEYSVGENIILENFKKLPFSSRGWLNFSAINKYARKLVKDFEIRPDDETYI